MDPNSRDLRWLRPKPCSVNGNCVEVAEGGGNVLLRSSLHPHGPVLPLTYSEFWGLGDSFAAGGFTGLIGEGERMDEGRTGDGATAPRSSPRDEERRPPRGNEEAAGTAHPGVSKPLEGVFSLIIRVEPGEARANQALRQALISGAGAVVILASWRPAVAVPLVLVAAAPKLASGLQRVVKSVEINWG